MLRAWACLFGLALLLSLASFGAQAQATRTWVSGVGDDANPCSRTAPCRTFSGAISKTAAGGVINVLDPGAYGAVTITKALTIEADGALAGVLVNATNGIIVNAGASDSVSLRGLQFHGLGSGLSAVSFLGGRQLLIERCQIEAFAQSGINFAPTVAANLVVRDTVIRSVGTGAAGFGGIVIAPGAGGSVGFSMDRVQILDSRFGLSVTGPANGAMRDSTITGSTENGVIAIGGADVAAVSLAAVHVLDSALSGVNAQGANAVIRLGDSTLTGNAQGILASGGGQVVSFGDNHNDGNLVNGAPTSTISQQ